MDLNAQKKWDSFAPLFDLMGGFGPEKRWAPFKRELFTEMGDGNILFLAIGTGLDIAQFPPGRRITGIDISPKMMAKAEPRAKAYDGEITLRHMDAQEMDFEDGSFDQVFTSCTFCSVPDPIRGLGEVRRVLKPGGQLRMFEHTGSHVFPTNLMMKVMDPVWRNLGPSMVRETVNNVQAAGFEIERVDNLFMDVVKAIRARKP